ncbi:MAG TPA: SPFH domain-containing protein [Anaerolineae bacterium]|nr:SPFH domain-containing protein [Anaerolineae bacterium]HQK15545.1 SPFH domain-containing protein [Anaerolineae bacterium]
MNNITKRQRAELIFLGETVLCLAFVVFLLITYWVVGDSEGQPLKWNGWLSVLIVGMAFFACVYVAKSSMWQLFTQFARHFLDISEEDAREWVERLLLGLPIEPPFKPSLRVFEGQADPDGPSVMFKVGGPGFLSIAHDSAVVTSRLGRLCRVLGPGFYELASFERVWDVIDLRPQRRTLRVEFMTLDGIPAYCDAEIRFRVADPPEDTRSFYVQEEATTPQAYPFNAEAVLKLATNKYVRSHEGNKRIQDWCVGLVNGALDGIIRDKLEQYTLDDFINPRYWAMYQDSMIEPAVPPPAKPEAFQEVQKFVEERIAAVAKERGIFVESVQLMPVQPAEEAISRQWLEFWQAKLQRSINTYALDEEAKRVELLAAAGVEAQVELVNTMLTKIEGLAQKGVKVPPQLIVTSFLDVLRAMADRDLEVQQLMFQQAEGLLRVVNAIRKEKTPFGSTSSVSTAPPTAPQLPEPKA